MKLCVREQTIGDIGSIIDYFLLASPTYLKGMGADPTKLPSRENWEATLIRELQKPHPQKSIYYVIWLADGQPVGHSNINQIQFGEQAYMHLHLWQNQNRQKGLGQQFLQLSLPYYFENFQLQQLYCEPYAFNPAPNRTLPKLGFQFLRQYETIPGPINLLQTVNRYVLSREGFTQTPK